MPKTETSENMRECTDVLIYYEIERGQEPKPQKEITCRFEHRDVIDKAVEKLIGQSIFRINKARKETKTIPEDLARHRLYLYIDYSKGKNSKGKNSKEKNSKEKNSKGQDSKGQNLVSPDSIIGFVVATYDGQRAKLIWMFYDASVSLNDRHAFMDCVEADLFTNPLVNEMTVNMIVSVQYPADANDVPQPVTDQELFEHQIKVYNFLNQRGYFFRHRVEQHWYYNSTIRVMVRYRNNLVESSQSEQSQSPSLLGYTAIKLPQSSDTTDNNVVHNRNKTNKLEIVSNERLNSNTVLIKNKVYSLFLISIQNYLKASKQIFIRPIANLDKEYHDGEKRFKALQSTFADQNIRLEKPVDYISPNGVIGLAMMTGTAPDSNVTIFNLPHAPILESQVGASSLMRLLASACTDSNVPYGFIHYHSEWDDQSDDLLKLSTIVHDDKYKTLRNYPCLHQWDQKEKEENYKGFSDFKKDYTICFCVRQRDGLRIVLFFILPLLQNTLFLRDRWKGLSEYSYFMLLNSQFQMDLYSELYPGLADVKEFKEIMSILQYEDHDNYSLPHEYLDSIRKDNTLILERHKNRINESNNSALNHYGHTFKNRLDALKGIINLSIKQWKQILSNDTVKTTTNPTATNQSQDNCHLMDFFLNTANSYSDQLFGMGVLLQAYANKDGFCDYLSRIPAKQRQFITSEPYDIVKHCRQIAENCCYIDKTTNPVQIWRPQIKGLRPDGLIVDQIDLSAIIQPHFEFAGKKHCFSPELYNALFYEIIYNAVKYGSKYQAPDMNQGGLFQEYMSDIVITREIITITRENTDKYDVDVCALVFTNPTPPPSSGDEFKDNDWYPCNPTSSVHMANRFFTELVKSHLYCCWNSDGQNMFYSIGLVMDSLDISR